MCRYAVYGPYKSHFACFECRKMFRRSFEARDHYKVRHGMTLDEARALPVPCPDCGRPMHNMGLDFKAPRQDQADQWEKVRQLFVHGYRWSSCGCSGPGFTVATLKDVQPFLQAEAQKRVLQSRAQQSREKWDAQRQRVRKARQQRNQQAITQAAALRPEASDSP